MRLLATTNGAALLALTVTMAGCGEQNDSASTPDDALTERSDPAARPAPEAEPPQREATQPAPAAARTGEPRRVDSPVIDTEGSEIGTLSIEPGQRGVRLALHVEGLSPGEHAVHFHEHGRCDPPEFESAGDHYNPTGAQHGMPDTDQDPEDQEHHVGDMLNQTVNDQGMLDTVMVNYTATLSEGPTTLLDEDGSALVIHADPDDYESQPAGNAGARVACAVVSRAQAESS